MADHDPVPQAVERRGRSHAVQFGPLASIVPGPGAIFFAAVVVLTMLASASFDPRLTWDPVQEVPSER